MPTTPPPATTEPPVVVPVTTAPPGPTTTPAPGETTTTTTSTTTTTVAAPITETGPFDFRLTVLDQPNGPGATASQAVAEGTRLEVTDIVFQNPTGATGAIIVRRAGSPIFEVQMANFRDLDYHFIAPYVFEAGETIEVVLVCATQGTLNPLNDEADPGACRASVSFAGFSTTTS